MPGVDLEQVVAAATDECVVTFVRHERIVAATTRKAIRTGPATIRSSPAPPIKVSLDPEPTSWTGLVSELASTRSFEPVIRDYLARASRTGGRNGNPTHRHDDPARVDHDRGTGLIDDDELALSAPTPPSLSVSVAVATRMPSGLGIGNVKLAPCSRRNRVAVLHHRPRHALRRVWVQVSDIGRHRDRPDVCIHGTHDLDRGGTLFTTINVPAKVVLRRR